MPDPRLYASDTYVVLEAGQEEQFLTTAELLEKLRSLLATRQEDLPKDVRRFAAVDEQAAYLLDNTCEWEVEPGAVMQWYAVRLEK